MVEEKRLFDSSTRNKLQQLMLMASRVRAGAIKGERRSKKRGTSIEFADYRNYTRGDDLRRLDWNLYARLERPYIKLLEDEEDLAVHVILDASASMDFPKEGDFDHNKLIFGQRLMAGLGYIAMTSNDYTLLTTVGGDGMRRFGPVRGRAPSVKMMRFVGSLEAGGVTSLNTTLQDYALRVRRPGICMVITDMFSPDGYLEGLNALLAKGYEVALFHLLSPDEVEPPLAGDLRLIDIETGEPQEVTIDAVMRDLYIRRLDEWRSDIRAECSRRGVHYIQVNTNSPWERVLLYELRRLGLVR